MEHMLEVQPPSDPQKAEVADKKLLHAFAELARPAMGPLNIICISSGAAKISLLAYGDTLLAELDMGHPTGPTGVLQWRVLHVRSRPIVHSLLLRMLSLGVPAGYEGSPCRQSWMWGIQQGQQESFQGGCCV